MNLSRDEEAAKEYFISLIKSAPGDICSDDLLKVDLPSWYDEVKFKRGQKFFNANRFSILLNATVLGGVLSLTEPRMLQILDSTGRSSTAATAQKRYVETLFHFYTWYLYDLSPNSVSRQSLDKVRKLHILASSSSLKKGLGGITQFDLMLTHFGFFGFPFLRPDLLGIQEDKEGMDGFIHFWAIIGRMIGVKDQYNICFLPLNTCKIVCKILNRYLFFPAVQTENKLFKRMLTAFTQGLSDYLPEQDYDAQLFLSRQIIGVPGYQYGVDLKREHLLRSGILSKKEIETCNKYLKKYFGNDFTSVTENLPIYEENKNSEKYEYIVKYINYETEYHKYLNDAKFSELPSGRAKNIVRLRYWNTKLYQFWFTRMAYEAFFSLYMIWMKRKAANLLKLKET